MTAKVILSGKACLRHRMPKAEYPPKHREVADDTCDCVPCRGERFVLWVISGWPY